MKTAINRGLRLFAVELNRLDAAVPRDQQDFLPFDETIGKAQEAGLSVGDYIDTVMNRIPGATESTVAEMSRHGVFAKPVRTVVEIGPGSGRYLEHTLKRCTPERYECYETAIPWARYLKSRYPIVLRPTDGRSLTATEDDSADLVQAHKVFCSVNFMNTCSYWPEIVRVTAPGGHAVFDIMTEKCLDADTLDAWAKSGINAGSYPAATPRDAAVSYFCNRGFDLVGSFFVPMPPGRTETFVFRKRSDDKHGVR